MSSEFNVYEFAEFTLDEEEGLLLRNGVEVLLTKTEFRILRFLIENRGKPISAVDMLDTLWGMESEAEEGNVAAHIKGIRNKLGLSDREKFIKTERNKKGYTFIFEPVIEHKKPDWSIRRNVTEADGPVAPTGEVASSKPAFAQTEKFGVRNTVIAAVGLGVAGLFVLLGVKNWNCSGSLCSEQTVFITIATVCYGLLVGQGLLLECSYDFDRYGWNVTRMIPSTVFISSAAMFAALSSAGRSLQAGGNYAFWTGLLFLIIGAAVCCLLAAFVLPLEPVTAAKFQTQSAIGAFVRNALMYFLPLYTIFGLLIFCLIYGSSETSRSILFPVAFAVVWIVFFVFSFLSTNYLSDSLLIERDGLKFKYHSLFSTLLQLRIIFAFMPSLASIIFYFLHNLNSPAP